MTTILVRSTALATPDWVHQLAWFTAGVFATGALWYYAGQKNSLATLWSAFAALVTCALAVTLMIRNDLIRHEDSTTATKQEAIHAVPTAPADRHLSLEQTNVLITSINQFEGQPVVIGFVLGDTETQVFAQEIAQTLASARWNVKRVVPTSATYRGLYLSPQDPTDVPRAAEALISALGKLGFAVRREYEQPTSFEYNGNVYVPTLYLTVGKNGAPSVLPDRYAAPLIVPIIPRLPARLNKVSDRELATYAEETAAALRDFETRNRRRFEAEWRIHDEHLPDDSYRGAFETVLRPVAGRLKSEMQKRLKIGPTTVWAVDADALDGLQPLRDAASYLQDLASKLQSRR